MGGYQSPGFAQLATAPPTLHLFFATVLVGCQVESSTAEKTHAELQKRFLGGVTETVCYRETVIAVCYRWPKSSFPQVDTADRRPERISLRAPSSFIYALSAIFHSAAGLTLSLPRSLSPSLSLRPFLCYLSLPLPLFLCALLSFRHFFVPFHHICPSSHSRSLSLNISVSSSLCSHVSCFASFLSFFLI